MDEIGQAGPARALGHGARRELAATLRRRGDVGPAVDAFLAAYGSTVYDFIALMVGRGELADRVVTDTTLAVTYLAGWLRDDDLLTAWIFALARYECRSYPPVVWRERQWEGLRSLAINGPVGRRGSVPVDVVRMALLGLAPRTARFSSCRPRTASCCQATWPRSSESAMRTPPRLLPAHTGGSSGPWPYVRRRSVTAAIRATVRLRSASSSI